MIIFRKQYDKAKAEADNDIYDPQLKGLLEEAAALVSRAGEGVKSERSPLTIVEKVQIRDTTKLVEKLMIDINKDISRGRPADKNCEKLKKAMTALKTGIENIL